MQLIDVTTSYAHKIRRELMDTPAHFIKVFSLGNSKVVYKKKFNEANILISNKLRPITAKEIEFVKKAILGEHANEATTATGHNLVEIVLHNKKQLLQKSFLQRISFFAYLHIAMFESTCYNKVKLQERWER